MTSNGDFWRRQRRLVQPAFHTQRITAYADTMVNYSLGSRWRIGPPGRCLMSMKK